MVGPLESEEKGGVMMEKRNMEKLKLNHIHKTFIYEKKQAEVLQEINISVGEGEFVSIIGPSGSGKSTLFHIIGGLILPTSGQVFLDGNHVTGKRGLISYMPQTNSLFPWRTVEDNVIMAQEIAGIPKKIALEQAREWLPKVGLAGYEKAYPDVLSGGMQQRVAFLRALLSPQELMCLDEPLGALDALTRINMQEWLLSIWETNKRSVLFVTHSIEEALYLSDRIYIFSNKPTCVVKEIVVPFARPRNPSSMLGSDFVNLRQEIYELMRVERY